MRTAALHALLAEQSIDALIATDPADVLWLTGFFVREEAWPSPRDVPVAAVVAEARPVLVAPSVFAQGPLPDVDVRRYEAYALGERLDVHANFGAELESVLEEVLPSRARVGVQGALPLATALALRERVDLVACEGVFGPLRMIKDDAEIELIRENARLCDLFQQSVREGVVEGASEVEIFASARVQVERAAGGRVSMLGDLVSADRCLDGGGDPTRRRVQRGDPVLADASISSNGYWADNCTTTCVGAPTDEFRRVTATVREALLRCMEACRPDVRAGEVDAIGRAVLARRGLSFHHHLGHGVGASYHEPPRLVPGAETPLEAGMVLCLEPAAFRGTTVGVRLEVVGVVRPDGLEPLSHVPELS